jgi:hypothetical protein
MNRDAVDWEMRAFSWICMGWGWPRARQRLRHLQQIVEPRLGHRPGVEIVDVSQLGRRLPNGELHGLHVALAFCPLRFCL